MASISVVMPIYNAEKYLHLALESILNQTFIDFELIALNDGSSDNSLQILNEYASGDARIRIFSKPNTGLIDTLNFGLSLARAPVIARMDADDISTRNRFDLQYGLISRGYDIVGGHYSIIGRKNRIITVPVEPELIALKLLFGPPFPHGSAMFKKDVIKKCKYDKSKYDKCEDYYLWCRAVEAGFSIANVDEVIFEYRETPGSLSRVNYHLMMKQTKELGVHYSNSRGEFLVNCLNRISFPVSKEKTLLCLMSAIRLTFSTRSLVKTYAIFFNIKYLPEAVCRMILKRY